MILKLLISCFFGFSLIGCSNGSASYFSSKDKEYISSKEIEFEKELKNIFSEIDNSRESIRTVEEKQKSENWSGVAQKNNSIGSESFFRNSVLQRFKDE